MIDAVLRSAVILRNGNSFGRWKALSTFAKLEFKQSFGLTRRVEMICGHHIGFAEYPDFVDLFAQVFLSDDYYFESQNASPRIIDCGANIGMATCYFLCHYPSARITAIEAAPASFALLDATRSRNQWKKVECVHAALGKSEGPIAFYCGTKPASTVASSIGGRGPTVDVPGLRLSSVIDGNIDFLKVDIEGSEVDVLEEVCTSGKLRLVRCGVFEYHHHETRNPDELGRFLSLLEDEGFGYHLNAPWRGAFAAQPRPQPIMIGVYRR
jgi:FkbM family methyltransferase